MSDQMAGVAESLGAHRRLLPFLPSLLQDLWSLGFQPDPLVRVLELCGITDRQSVNVLDLGCGKGAALIRMAQEFGWHGEGVDLVPAFVDEARRRAREAGVDGLVRFEIADMGQTAREGAPVDLILFGFDTEVLGSLQESLTIVRSRLARGGRVVLDTVWAREQRPSTGVEMPEGEVKRAISAAGLDVVAEERLDPQWVREQNHANTEQIRRRAEALGLQHPDKRSWFEDYVRCQEQECSRLEKDLECAILLLAPRF